MALRAYRDRVYSTRKEYCVTGVVLVAIDELLSTRGLVESPFPVPTSLYPFWIYPTAIILD